MTIYFKAGYRANVIDYLSIEAPPNWEEMSHPDRLTWLLDNLDSAQLSGREIEDEWNQFVLGFQTSA